MVVVVDLRMRGTLVIVYYGQIRVSVQRNGRGKYRDPELRDAARARQQSRERE